MSDTREQLRPREPDWAAIGETAFLWEEDCWRTCGGGFCCGSVSPPEFQFRILPMNGAAIAYLGEEYDWMVSHGRGPWPEMRKREFTFDFGGPKPLRVMIVDCTLKGLCTGCMIKPLLCRIYPFLPIFDMDEALVDLYPASTYDLTFLRSAEDTPCTIWHKRRDHYLDLWRAAPDTDLLRHPRLMFYFAAYKCFADLYLEKLDQNEALAGLSGADYWSKWEMLYLGRKLFDTPQIKAAIHAVYLNYHRKYGDFL